MSEPAPADDGEALRTGLALLDCSLGDLWIRYFELGGTMSSGEFLHVIETGAPLSPPELDIALVALNEMAEDVGLGRPVRYTYELDD